MNEEKRMNEKTEPINFEYGHLYSTFYHIKSYLRNPDEYYTEHMEEKEREYSRKKEERLF